EPVHLYQIWLLPERAGLKPGYEQKPFDPVEKHNRLRLVASPDAADGSLTIHQDARLYLADLDASGKVTHSLGQRHGWLQVRRGKVPLKDEVLSAGDGAAISGEADIAVSAEENSEVLLFDLA